MVDSWSLQSAKEGSNDACTTRCEGVTLYFRVTVTIPTAGVPVAYGLHRRASAVDAPFIVCDPRRGNTAASVRSPANVVDPATAFAAAEGRSLCIRRHRPPRGFASLVARLRGSESVQYICLDEDSLQWLVRPGLIVVTPMTERARDVPAIVDEYMFDAVLE